MSESVLVISEQSMEREHTACSDSMVLFDAEGLAGIETQSRIECASPRLLNVAVP